MTQSDNQYCRVVVCGSNFGILYIKAIDQNPELKLVGIVSRGSEQSHKIAEEFHTVLYNGIDHVPWEQVDVAVVAVKSTIAGGKGSELAKEILKRGVSVIIEQPVHFSEVQECIRLCKRGKNAYTVSNFYRYLQNVQKFMECIEFLRNQAEIMRIFAKGSFQLLFPLIDILSMMTDLHDDLRLECLHRGRVSLFHGTAGHTEVDLELQNEYEPGNLDGSIGCFFSICVETDAGNLELTDPHGPVIWRQHFAMPFDSEINMDFQSEILQSKHPNELLQNIDGRTYDEIYNSIWPQAMAAAILDLYKKKNGAINKMGESLLNNCKVWSEIGRMLGIPVKISRTYKKFLQLNEFVDK